jgi:hypothetical protein
VDLLLERSIAKTVDVIELEGVRQDRWERVEQGCTMIFALNAEAEREGMSHA